ncbi:MAG: flagellar protein FlgN [Lachnospiraceae bacterium]|nr:flagellar protein FlgN [Lachnospiraceae bacterium]
MASLMENIIMILNQEDEAYRELVKLSELKTPVIIKGDLPELNRITEEEQVIVGRIQKFEKDRIQTMKDIADVTNHASEELKIIDLINMMASRPEEQRQLREIHDKLKMTLGNMSIVNERNRDLLKSSLEMVQFEMTLLQSMKQAPETADYNRGAYNTGSIMGSGTKRFDAKQ